MSETTPVFSRRAVEDFTPPDSPRTYRIAPLTYLQKIQVRGDLARMGATWVWPEQLLEAIRAAVRELAPANMHELLEVVQIAQELPDDAAAQADLASLEAAVGSVPVYANLRATRELWFGLSPWVTARYALRGWDGPGLPPFRRVREVVPDELLDLVPPLDLAHVGRRASEMMQVVPAAEKNSEPPSGSPENPETTPGG